MKKFFLLLALVATVVAADAKAPKSTDLELRIGTYNIWSHQARASRIRKNNAAPERNWDTSKKAVVQHIIDLDCDVMALQEVTNVCYEDLTNLLKKGKGKKYAIWWENVYPEGMRQIGSAVLYNKKRFTLSQQKIYYFSPTPEVRSKGWDEKRFFRASLATVITEKASGRKFLLFAAHGPLAKEAKVHAGRLLVEFDKNYNTEALPTIALGDMNARPDGEFHQAMCAHYEDCALVAKEKLGTPGSFNSYQGSEEILALPYRRIDHIYVHSTDKGKFEVLKYEVDTKKFKIGGNMHYPSDHCPVVVDMKLK